MNQTGYTHGQVEVGQRVKLNYYGKTREGKVMEIHPGSGWVRVEIDLATMHEWVRPDALTPVEPPDDLRDVVVAWEYEGCPHYSLRRMLQGVVLDVRTRLGDMGAAQVYVKSPELNLPKWVDIDDVQFVAQKQTAEAVASAVA